MSMVKWVNDRYYNVPNLNDSPNVYTASLKYLHIWLQERGAKVLIGVKGRLSFFWKCLESFHF